MKVNPKYMPAIERAEKAALVLKSLGSDTQTNEATRKQMHSQATQDLADWRYTMDAFFDSASELKVPRQKLEAAQKKLSELRSQLKNQLELHPDLKSADKKWDQAKLAHDKDLQQLASIKRKAAADQSKLVAERAQLAKAAMQDKQNDNKQ